MRFFWKKKVTGASVAKTRLEFMLKTHDNHSNLYILNYIKSDVSDLLKQHIDIKYININKDPKNNDLYNLSIIIKPDKTSKNEL